MLGVDCSPTIFSCPGWIFSVRSGKDLNLWNSVKVGLDLVDDEDPLRFEAPILVRTLHRIYANKDLCENGRTAAWTSARV